MLGKSLHVVILLLLLWLAWLCSVLVIGQCNFMSVTTMSTTQYGDIFEEYNNNNNNNQSSNDDDINDKDDDTAPTSKQTTGQKQHKTFGLFSRPFYDNVNDDNDGSGTFLGCVRYSGNNDSNSGETVPVDSKFHVGQAFGIITVLLLTLSCIILTPMILCFRYDPYRELLWRTSHYISILAAITQMLIFIALGSTSKCYDNSNSNTDDAVHYDYQNQTEGCTLSGSGKLAIWNTIVLNGICLYWLFVTVPCQPILQFQFHIPLVESKSSHFNQQDESSDNQDENSIGISASVDKIHTEHGVQIDDTEFSLDLSEIRSTSADGDDNEQQQSTTSINIDDTTSTGSGSANPVTLGHNQQQQQQQRRTIIHIRFVCVFLFCVAWMISMFGIHRCTFISIAEEQLESGVGLFQMAIYENYDNNSIFLGCVSYPDRIKETFDRSFRTSRTFGSFTAIFTSALLLVNVIQLFHHPYSRFCNIVSRVVTWIGMPVTIVSQATTFAIMRSEVCSVAECRLGGTGIMIILNIVLMVLLTIILYKVRPLEVPIFKVSNVDVVEDACSNSPDKSIKKLDENEMNCTKIAGISDTQSCTESNQNSLPIASITTQVEYSNWGNKKTTITTFLDGSQMIQTTIEELSSSCTSSDLDYYDEESNDEIKSYID